MIKTIKEAKTTISINSLDYLIQRLEEYKILVEKEFKEEGYYKTEVFYSHLGCSIGDVLDRKYEIGVRVYIKKDISQ